MSKSILNYSVIFLTACAVLLPSCSLQATNTPERPIVSTGTATPLPVTATASPSLEPTLVPTETLIPSPTPIPWASQPITADNAKEIKEINRWGRGTPVGIQRLKRGEDQFLVLTSLGVYLYQTKVPYVLAFFPEADQGYVSQDEKLLAVGLKNGDVQIWNMDDLSLKQTFTHKFPEDIVKKIKEEQLIPFYVGGMAISPDNSEIAVGYADGAIDLFRMGEDKPYVTLRHDSFSLWQTDIGLVFQLSYSPDGKNLVVFKYAPYINANRLTFWSLPEGKLVSVSEAARFYEFMEPAYLPDGQTLLISSRKDSYLYLTLWNARTGKKLNSFATGLMEIISAEVTPDGKQATIYGEATEETGEESKATEDTKKEIYYRRVWTLPDGKLLENEKLDQHPEAESQARIDKFLFEQGHYRNGWGEEDDPKFAQIGVLENQAFRVLGESHWLAFPEGISKPLDLPKDVVDPYYDPQEQTMSWCTKGAFHYMEKDSTITNVEVSAIAKCDGAVLSPQRHYAAVWYGQALYLINLETLKFNKLSVQRWYRDIIFDVRFSPDEKIIISTMPYFLAVWQVEPPLKLADSHDMEFSAGNNRDIVISKDKSFAVTLIASRRIETDESRIVIWRVADAFTLHRIQPPFLDTLQPEFTTFALSPNETLIASGDNFGGIRIWDVKSGEQLASFDIDALPVDLAFTPDGSNLIIVLGDGTVRLWGVP